MPPKIVKTLAKTGGKKRKTQDRVKGLAANKGSGRAKYYYTAYWSRKQVLKDSKNKTLGIVAKWAPISSTNNPNDPIKLMQTSANGAAKKFVSWIHRRLFPKNRSTVELYILQRCIRKNCNSIKQNDPNQNRTRVYIYEGKFCLKKQVQQTKRGCLHTLKAYRDKTTTFNSVKNDTEIKYRGLSEVQKLSTVQSIPFTDLPTVKIVLQALDRHPDERKLFLRRAMYACAQPMDIRNKLMRKLKERMTYKASN